MLDSVQAVIGHIFYSTYSKRWCIFFVKSSCVCEGTFSGQNSIKLCNLARHIVWQESAGEKTTGDKLISKNASCIK